MQHIRRFNLSIVLLLTAASVSFGIRIARNIFSLLEFQLVVYDRLLAGQASVNSVREGVANTRDSITSLRSAKEELRLGETGTNLTNEEKLLYFRKKLRRTAGSIGSLFGLLARKVLFDFFYAFQSTLRRLSELIVRDTTEQTR